MAENGVHPLEGQTFDAPEDNAHPLEGQTFDAPDDTVTNDIIGSSTPNPQNKELILDGKVPKFDINKPWQENMNYEGYNLDLTDPKVKAQYDSLLAIESVKNPAIEGAKALTEGTVGVIKTGLDVLQIPVRVGSGLYARTSNLGTPYNDKSNVMSQALDKFMNPPELETLRQKFNYDTSTAYGLITGFGNEVAPELLPSEVISDVNKDRILGGIGAAAGILSPEHKVVNDYMGKVVEGLVGPEGKKALKNFIFDVGLDPAMWVSLFPSFAAATKMANTESVAVRLNKAADAAYSGQKVSGMAAKAQRGEKALLAIQVPFTDVTLAKYEGLKTLQQLDDFTAYANNVLARTPFRVLSQRTPYETFDMASTGKHLRDSGDAIEIAAAKDSMEAQGLNNERIIRLSDDIREFGSENRAMLKGQDMGMNYTYEELELAQKRNEIINQVIDDTNAKWNKVTGDNISRDDFAMRNLSDADKEKYIKEMEALGVNIKRIVVNGEDLTFSRNYDGGRSLSDDMLATPEGRRARNIFESSNRASKFYTAPSSSMERNALSTDAMNQAYNQLGYKEGAAFNVNSTEAILNKALERRKAANNLEFLDFASKNYGVKSPLEAEMVIGLAQNRIKRQLAEGVSPTAEDLMLSKMRPEDFVPPSPQVISRLKSIYGEKNLKALEAGNTHFPRDIARKFETMIEAEPTKSQIMKGLSDYQRLMSRNMLTNVTRIPKQLIDNMSRMTALRAMPEFIEEAALAVKRAGQSGIEKTGKLLKKDWGTTADILDQEANSIPAIVETAWDLKDFKSPIKVNSKMVKDPEARDVYYSWLEKLNDGVKFNKQNEALGYVKQGGQWIKSSLHPTDNPISSFIRYVGNGTDNLSRRALYKKYRKMGYGIEDSVALVQNGLMDFQNTSKALRGMRYVSPFASFHIKNLESIPQLIASSPGVANVIRPDEKGYLYKHIQDWRGWDPKDSRLLEKIFPINNHPVYFGLMKGKDKLIANSGVFDKYLNKYLEAGLTPEQIGKMEGNALTFTVPTFLEAAFGFADFKNTLSSPFTKALVALNGDNPFTGEPLKNYGLGIKNIYAAASQVNPLNYPKFYNQVVMPQIAKIKPELVEALQAGPLGPMMTDLMKIQFGDGPIKSIGIDEDTIRTITSNKFLGLGSLDLLDRNYIMYQRALMKAQAEIVSSQGGRGAFTEAALKSGKNREMLAILKQLKNISSDIKSNTQLYFELRKKYPKTLAPDEAQSVQMIFDPEAADKEEVPADEGESPEQPVEESFLAPQQERMPASQSDKVVRDIKINDRDALVSDSALSSPSVTKKPTVFDIQWNEARESFKLQNGRYPTNGETYQIIKKEADKFINDADLLDGMSNSEFIRFQEQQKTNPLKQELYPDRSPAGLRKESEDLFKDNPEIKELWQSLPDDKKDDALKEWIKILSEKSKEEKK